MKKIKKHPITGFALIATISILSLVVLISLAILSLSTVVTRTSSHSRHISIAKANARLALSEAIGNLQEAMGPDTRVSASSGIVSSSTHKHILGVWESTGDGTMPLYEGPNYGTNTTNANLAASYTSNRATKFKKWLIPGAPNADMSYYVGGAAGASDITLLGAGSLEADPSSPVNSNLYVTAPIQELKEGLNVVGGYSWWISGENQKVRIALEPKTTTTTAEKATTLLTATNTNPHTISEFSTYDESEAKKHITLKTALYNSASVHLPDTAKKHFHTVSPYAKGLLTNTATGGLKKDLSLLSEFQPTHADINNVAIGTGLPSYNRLMEFMRTYKDNASGGLVEWIDVSGNQIPHFSPGTNLANIMSKPDWRGNLIPMSKLYVIISHYAVRDGSFADGSERYAIRMSYNVIEELWNPYSIPYHMPRNSSGGSDITARRRFFSVPYGLTYYKNGALHVDEDSGEARCEPTGKAIYAMLHQQAGGGTVHRLNTNYGRILQPGEAVVYSDDNNSDSTYTREINMVEGWEPAGGLFTWALARSGSSSPLLHFRLTDEFQPQLLKMSDTSGYPAPEFEAGGFLRYSPYNSPFLSENWLSNNSIPWDWSEQWFTDIYQIIPPAGETARNADGIAINLPLNNDDKATISTILGEANKKPLAIVGCRRKTETSLPMTSTTDSQNYKSKHYLFSSFAVQKMDFGSEPSELAHSSYEFFCQPFSDYGSASGIFDINANNQGYVGTSVSAQTPFAGQNHMIVREIPFMPIVSMAQLQHARLGHMDLARQQHHPTVNWAFGNSFATPFVEPDHFKLIDPNVRNPQSPRDLAGTMSDKSFMLNESIWDSWFMSSISNQTNPFVDSPLQHTAQQVIEGVINNTRELPNRRYKFSTQRNGTAATTLRDSLMDVNGFKEVAEHLTCEGAFNVNSVNEDAWRAFLTSLDGQTLAILDYQTNALRDHDASYVVSRFSLPTNDPADSDNYVPATQQTFLDRRWQGARKLTASELNDLASEMVKQVKLRGPFLSLGDFVNRQLRYTDATEKRHLKGALQAAIDATDINKSFLDTSDSVSSADATTYGYTFPEAGTGKIGVGAPGYVTQADLLTPLASQLRVRDDTFVIRAYGESKQGGKVMARAYCEAVVQRGYDYVDPADSANKEIIKANGSTSGVLSTTNQKYGRRFRQISFRWLNEKEV